MQSNFPVEFKFSFDNNGTLHLDLECQEGLEEAAGQLLVQLTGGGFNDAISKEIFANYDVKLANKILFGMFTKQILNGIEDMENMEDVPVIRPSEVFGQHP